MAESKLRDLSTDFAVKKILRICEIRFACEIAAL